MSGQGGPRADGAVVRCVGGAELLRVRVLTVPVVRNGSGAGLLRYGYCFVRAGAGTAVPCGRPERARVVRLGGAVVPGYVRLGCGPVPARLGRGGWCALRWCGLAVVRVVPVVRPSGGAGRGGTRRARQAGENRWSLMSRAPPITPAAGPNSPRTMGRLPVASGSDWR